MDKENENKQQSEDGGEKHQPPYISSMQPLTRDAYGGGMYAAEEGGQNNPVKDGSQFLLL